MKTYLLAMLTAALFASVSAFAETSFPEENQKLEANSQIALRASSPDSSFGSKGEQIGWIKAGTEIKVISAKQHSTVFGFEVWVEVVSLSDASVKGWVFDGMSSDVLKGKGKLQPIETEAVLAQLE